MNCKNYSFKQWCLDNDRVNILLNWDYELNKIDPEDVPFKTNKKYWFKCPLNKHPSELKRLDIYVSGHVKTIECIACKSFGQWLIDNYGENAICEYFSEENNVDPFSITCGSEKYVLIKCQEKDYHGSYKTQVRSFVNGSRCPYCTTRNGKVHKNDSLGQLLFNLGLINLWSEKNTRSPYEYTPYSSQKVWWKCANNKHNDYERNISDSHQCNFRCPLCNNSRGEIKISNYLEKNKIDFIYQKTYEGLLGVNNGNLSFDFYLPQYNLLIEYDGEMHYMFVKGIHKSIKDFKKQVEHDRRKTEFANKNGIKLLRISYLDYDNIENILENKLNLHRILK